MKKLLLIIFTISHLNIFAQNINVILNGNSPIDCYSNYGEIWISNVNGGTPPYNYLWSTGATGSYISYLTQGTYSVTVTDANLNTGAASFIINELPYFIGYLYYYAPTPGNCDGGMLFNFYHTELVNVISDSYPFNINFPTYIGAIAYKICQYENPITIDLKVGTGGTNCPWQYNGITLNPAVYYAGPYTIQTTINPISNCSANGEIKIINPHKIDPQSMLQGIITNYPPPQSAQIRDFQNNVVKTFSSPQIQYLDSIIFNIDSLPTGDYVFHYTEGIVYTWPNDTLGIHLVDTFSVTGSGIAPSATITPSGSTSICAGSFVTLNANTGTGLTYQWKLNGNNINGATSSFYSANSAGNYTVVVTNACGSSTSNVISVTVSSAPSAAIIASGSTSFCTGSSVTLTANTGTGLSYQWQLNGNNISGATNSNYDATTSGNYSVIVSNNCGNSISNIISVTSTSAPGSAGSISGPDTVCKHTTHTFSVNPVAGTTNYVWSVPPQAQIISGAGTNSIAVNFKVKQGNVTLKAANQCGAGPLSVFPVTVVKCFNANNAVMRTISDSEISIYPNPSKNEFNCVLLGKEHQVFSLSVFDYAGRIVELHENIISNQTFTFGNKLSPGFYFVEINSGDVKEIFKIIKLE